MTQKTIIIAAVSIIGLGLLFWLAFGFFGIQALWTDRTVNEAVPVAPTGLQPVLPGTATSTRDNEPTPTGPRIVAAGNFQEGDSTYTIRGFATITEENGIRTLSLTDFDVTNGPDLFVYLVPTGSAENRQVKDAVKDGSIINLGELKGNKGNQNYVLPADVNLNQDLAVSIWCRRFSRNFGAALLALPIEK